MVSWRGGLLKVCLTGSSGRAVVTPLSLLCTKYKALSKMLGDRLREVIGQAKQIHQSCCLPGRSGMNNLSRMTDVLDVRLPGITAVTEACHDAEVAEGQWSTMKYEWELQTWCFLSRVLYTSLLSFDFCSYLVMKYWKFWPDGGARGKVTKVCLHQIWCEFIQ